ncbi:MAG: helix-turn-helix transcriptional regulator [Hyphomicrobiales bacterium]|nr:helix-turn-helix transcriptional regulator [Hyphomicrobiales bacterium]
MALGGWAPILPLQNGSNTVGEFLQRFCATAEDQGGAASYRLEVEGKIAIWRLKRPRDTTSDVRHADATAVAFFVEILRQASGDAWDPSGVVAVTSDTTLIPDDILPPTSAIPGALGVSLRFQSDLLLLPLPTVDPLSDIPPTGLPQPRQIDLRGRVRQIIEQRVADRDFGIDQIAASVGLPKWRLQSLLRQQASNVARLRDQVRRELAVERLTTSAEAIASIAAALGYTSASNFTRAFRSWTGKTPKEFRNS